MGWGLEHGGGCCGQAKQFYKVAAATAALKPTERMFDKSCGQFHSLNSAELHLFMALDMLWEIRGARKKSGKGDRDRKS